MEDTDDSIVDVSLPTVIVIDLTKESPRSGRSSRSHRRNAEDVSSSHSANESPDRRFRRPLSPIVLGNTQDTQTFVYTLLISSRKVKRKFLLWLKIFFRRSPVKERKVPHATSSNEVLTLDDTIEENKTFYTVESDNREPVPLTCPICFESLSSNLKPITTRCGHLFCAECLETFIRTSKKCPTCKAAITLKSCTRLYL